MNYIYDIVLNFNKEYYNFFEWNKRDNIVNVKKIPLYVMAITIYVMAITIYVMPRYVVRYNSIGYYYSSIQIKTEKNRRIIIHSFLK